MNNAIQSFNLSEIPAILESLGQPRFRAKQLTSWLYQRGAHSYDEMTNLPKGLREVLANEYPLIEPQVVNKQVSSDGTRKYVFEYADGAKVEAVGIPSFDKKERKDEPKHLTVCFSTQAGCAMGCAFCATGREGLTRNLSSAEMICQIVAVQNDFGCRVTNLVSMGQGEPFQNYQATLEALRFANAKDGLEIGARHITVSTCGIIQGIEKLANEPEQFTLAVSLHSALQDVRNEIMPRCSNIPLPHLKKALQSYVEKTGRRVSFEYLLIKGVTDTEENLAALIDFCNGLLCHVNLLSVNEVEGSPYKPSSIATQQRWTRELKSAGKEATIRNSRGSDIDGALRSAEKQNVVNRKIQGQVPFSDPTIRAPLARFIASGALILCAIAKMGICYLPLFPVCNRQEFFRKRIYC